MLRNLTTRQVHPRRAGTRTLYIQILLAILCINPIWAARPVLRPYTPPPSNHNEGPATEADSTNRIDLQLDMDSVVILGERQGPLFHGKPQSQSLISVGDLPSAGTDLRALSALVPNLYLQQGGLRISTPIYIRGVGSTMGAPPVGLYIDGVPHLDRDAFLLALAGIERIELIRGPQSALYGRNSAIGQVNIRTLQPADHYDLQLNLSTGAYRDLGVFVTGNVPIGPVQIRGTFNRHSSRGYLTNLGEGNRHHAGREAYLGRLRTLFLLLAQGQITLGVDWNSSDDQGYGYHAIDSLKVNPFRVYYNTPASIQRERLNAHIRYHQPLPYRIEIECTASYALNRDWQTFDADFTHYAIFSNSRKVRQHLFTGEVILRQSVLPELQWIAGLFAHHQRNSTAFIADFGPDRALMLGPVAANLIQRMDFDNQTTESSIAAFLQLYGKEPYSGIEATAAIRYDHGNSSLNYHELVQGDGFIGTQPWGKQQTTIGHNKFLPRVVLQRGWGPTKAWVTYASYALGFKPGGFNAIDNNFKERSPNLAYGAETIHGYELGLKYRPASFPLYLSLNGFYIDWRDQQIFIIERMGPAIRNAGDVRSYGAEIEAVGKPLKWLSATTTAGYNHATYYRHNNPNVIGKRSVMAPQYSVTAALAGKWTLSQKHQIRLHAHLRYSAQGKQHFDELNTLTQPFHDNWYAAIAIDYRKLSLALHLDNILDRRYWVYMFKSPVGQRLPAYTNSGQVGSPRTWNIALSFAL